MNETTPTKRASIMRLSTCFSVNLPEMTFNAIQQVLEKAYLDWRCNPAYLFCSEWDHKKIGKEIMTESSWRGLPLPPDEDHFSAKVVFNQITGRPIHIITLPELEDGTLMFGFMTY